MTQAIRGMHDTLPEEIATWQQVEDQARRIFERYGFHEIRTPILEKTELFTQTLGEATDVVEKEMYTFADRNDESLSMRPEGTASVVRSALQHSLLHVLPQRMWYIGPMFRYEKPQKGRARQFHQIGVEVFGATGPDIDAELLMLTARLWRELGISEHVRLEINTLGNPEERKNYREALQAWLRERADQLDEDSKRRIDTNPLRVLDTKDPQTLEVIKDVPLLADYLQDESLAHYEGLKALLDAAGIAWVHNPRLVRGLDYYTHTVFEWVTDRLGAQGTICAGGRYDGLCALHGGKDVPGVGFAMGLERVVALVNECQDIKPLHPHVYLIMAGEAALPYGMALAERLRSEIPTLRLQNHIGGGGFKAQFKRADRFGAEFAMIIGEDEVNNGQAALKPLLADGEQQVLSEVDLTAFLRKHIEQN
jgi:histidyl-tRNA synthetase